MAGLADLILVDVEISNVDVTFIAEDFPDVFIDLRLDNLRFLTVQ